MIHTPKLHESTSKDKDVIGSASPLSRSLSEEMQGHRFNLKSPSQSVIKLPSPSTKTEVAIKYFREYLFDTHCQILTQSSFRQGAIAWEPVTLRNAVLRSQQMHFLTKTQRSELQRLT